MVKLVAHKEAAALTGNVAARVAALMAATFAGFRWLAFRDDLELRGLDPSLIFKCFLTSKGT